MIYIDTETVKSTTCSSESNTLWTFLWPPHFVSLWRGREEKKKKGELSMSSSVEWEINQPAAVSDYGVSDRTLHAEPWSPGCWVGKRGCGSPMHLCEPEGWPSSFHGQERVTIGSEGPLCAKQMGGQEISHNPDHTQFTSAPSGEDWRGFPSCFKIPDKATAASLCLNSLTTLTFHRASD